MFWEKGYINEAQTTELLVYWELYVRQRKSIISHFSALSLVCYKKCNGFMKKYLKPYLMMMMMMTSCFQLQPQDSFSTWPEQKTTDNIDHNSCLDRMSEWGYGATKQ